MSVTPLDPAFTGAELEHRVRLVIPARTSGAADRIAGVEAVTARIKGADETAAAIRLRPGLAVYFEQDEFAS